MLKIIKRIEADLHTHTVSSGHAYSTVDELAKSASKQGLKVIAITDHGPSLPGGPHKYHFSNMAILPEEIHGVRVLKGIEANILDNGELDLNDELLASLDFVAAGLHDDTGHTMSTMGEYTDAVIRAIENPYVNMITHPINVKYPLDINRVVKAARDNDVILEVNASSYNPIKNKKRGNEAVDVKMCKLAKKYGVKLSLNTDTHYHIEIGDIGSLREIIREAHLEERNVINTSAESLMRFLYSSRYKKKEIV